MPKDDRLFAITAALRENAPVTAATLAERLGVSVRTIYRDMDRLAAMGLPIEGTQGTGYRIADHVLLPPLTLTRDEIEALNLGLAIASELADPTLAGAAETLSAKIDAAQPAQSAPQALAKAPSPFSAPARGFAHLAPVRAAIAARQKLRITYTDTDGTITRPTVHPFRVAYWGRTWALSAWNETSGSVALYRLDLIESVDPLPELFTDAPGRSPDDFPL